MRITWLFGAAAAVVTLFGVGLLAVPAWLLGIYGLAMTTDGEIVARLLGAQLLGYAVLEWLCLRGGRELRVVTLRAAFVAELGGFVVSGLAALQGRGNTMLLSVVALFLVFAVWRGYYLITYRGA